jgi:transcription elongation factor GreA
MTTRGAEALRAELERLKSIERPRITAAIAEARAHGDLKENGEYHAAREQQSFCEARIKDIEGKLSTAHVIDVTKIQNQGRVIFGTTVEVTNLDTEEVMRYQIVGDDEADIKQGRISVKSPIGRGLIGRSLDAEVEIQTPSGKLSYQITKVEYL